MIKRKFPLLKLCEWLYYGALSAGILFVLYGFFQYELSRIIALEEPAKLLPLIAAGAFASQILVWLGEKGYKLQTALGLIAVNIAAGAFFLKNPESRFAFWCCIGLEAACVLSALMVYAARKTPYLKSILVIAEAACLVALAVIEKPLPAWCVCIILAAILLFLVELTAKGRKEALGLLPLFAASVLLIGFIPRNEKPLDWSWVSKAASAVREKAEMLVVDVIYLFNGENNFSFSFSGYGNNGSFNGVVLDREQVQLQLLGGTKNPLYLTGAVYEDYTSSGWKKFKEKIPEPSEDGILGAISKSIYSGQEKSLTNSSLMSVEYRFIKTEDFFHDLYTTNIYGDIPQFKKGDPWTMKKARGNSFKYQLRFLEFNEKSEEIKSLLRQKAWSENAGWSEAELALEKAVYDAYTGLPENIPDRVYDLAHSLSEGCDNDYDKMSAFAEYLNDFTYTTAPPACPKDSELTDYFLFESKKGYCTYFATAMAVLGRCEGIPTRYVQGFMTADTCKSARVDVTITGTHAHAWSEAYIEHVGWIRFDATPGYGGGAYSDNWTPIEFSGGGQNEKPQKPELPSSDKQEEAPEEDGKSPLWYALAFVKAVLAVAAGCVLAVAAVIWIRSTVRRRKYARADVQEKLRLQLKRLLKLGKLQGVPIAEGETLQAYQEHAHEILDTKEYSFSKACALYEGVRFGGKTVPDSKLRELEAYAGKAEQCYLATCGALKKLVYRII